MTTALTLFIISGIGIIFMVAVKYYQLTTGKIIFWYEWRARIESFTKRKIFSYGGKFSEISSDRISSVTKGFMIRSAILLFRLGKKLQLTAIAFLNKAKSNTVLKNKGSVSFYLRHVAEHKNNLKE